MRILFIGCVKSSYILLKELLDKGYNVCGVVTKRTSQFNSDFVDLTPLCHSQAMDVFYSDEASEIDYRRYVEKLSPDIIYCMGWSHLLKEEIILIPPLGVIGFHPAKLPDNKGRHPLIWALVLGLETTASTFFMIDNQVDNGDIVSQRDIEISYKDDASSLYEKVMKVAKIQLCHLTDDFISGEVVRMKQDGGNTWRKRSKKDGQIDFRMSALSLYNLIRGLTRPYVGAHFIYKENEYKVWKSEVIFDKNNSYTNIEYGKVIEVYSKSSFLVKTGSGLLKIIEADEIDLSVGVYL